MTSFNLNTSLKALSPNIVTLGVRASTYELDWGLGDTVQSITDPIRKSSWSSHQFPKKATTETEGVMQGT